jgi:hypothetical protein
MINLVTTFYISNYSSDLDGERSRELEQALVNNINSEHIEKIHLFVDNEQSHNKLLDIINRTNTEKIHVIEIGKKPQYSDFFRYAIENLKNKISMVSNADIYFHEYDARLLELLKNNRWAYALTRHEHDFSTPQMDYYVGSHDCYIFKPEDINEDIINHTQFYQNSGGIESRIIKAFCDQNIKVFNPCKQIKIVHLHASNLRNYGHWLGLHALEGGHGFFLESCWCIPPVQLSENGTIL